MSPDPAPVTDALRAPLADAHRRYSRRINFAKGWTGYLWQGRFASYPMDEAHLMTVIRYVAEGWANEGSDRWRRAEIINAVARVQIGGSAPRQGGSVVARNQGHATIPGTQYLTPLVGELRLQLFRGNLKVWALSAYV